MSGQGHVGRFDATRRRFRSILAMPHQTPPTLTLTESRSNTTTTDKETTSTSLHHAPDPRATKLVLWFVIFLFLLLFVVFWACKKKIRAATGPVVAPTTPFPSPFPSSSPPPFPTPTPPSTPSPHTPTNDANLTNSPQATPKDAVTPSPNPSCNTNAANNAANNDTDDGTDVGMADSRMYLEIELEDAGADDADDIMQGTARGDQYGFGFREGFMFPSEGNNIPETQTGIHNIRDMPVLLR